MLTSDGRKMTREEIAEVLTKGMEDHLKRHAVAAAQCAREGHQWREALYKGAPMPGLYGYRICDRCKESYSYLRSADAQSSGNT